MALVTEQVRPARFQWGAIFAGVAVALALTVVLTQFGGAIGLKADDPLRLGDDIATWGVIAAAIWILWTQLLSSLAGGYVAGYLRAPTPQLPPHQNELRDGLHGLTVWAASSVLVFIALAVAAFGASLVASQTDATQVTQAAEAVRRQENATVIFAFANGAISLISAMASWWAATKGGEHAIGTTDYSAVWTFRRLQATRPL
jgi:hypothetical protein